MGAAEFLLIINVKCFVLSIDRIISGFLVLKCFMLFLLLVSVRFSSAERSNPTSEVRGGSREELPHVQGAVAARAQEGLEELLHFQCQEGRLVQGKKQWLHFAGAAVKR